MLISDMFVLKEIVNYQGGLHIMSAKPIIAIVPLGHYIYFEQFDGLYEKLNQKSSEFVRYF